jgi:hypothetical protein
MKIKIEIFSRTHFQNKSRKVQINISNHENYIRKNPKNSKGKLGTHGKEF